RLADAVEQVRHVFAGGPLAHADLPGARAGGELARQAGARELRVGGLAVPAGQVVARHVAFGALEGLHHGGGNGASAATARQRDRAVGGAVAARRQVGGQQQRGLGDGGGHAAVPPCVAVDPATVRSSSNTSSRRSSHFSASSSTSRAASMATITAPSSSGTGRLSNSACIHGR